MLDRQEQDRLQEFRAREQRAQDFQNRMADTVIKGMDERAKKEEDKIRNYEGERERREQREDERKQQRAREEQARMRDFLARQMEDKKRKEGMERALNDEQAHMWKSDLKNYSEEERRLNSKITNINKENADFLKR